jgi:hypothetical protein
MTDATLLDESKPQPRTRSVRFKLPAGALEALIVIGGSVAFAAAGALVGAFLAPPFGAS